jgi:hypothetical protein
LIIVTKDAFFFMENADFLILIIVKRDVFFMESVSDMKIDRKLFFIYELLFTSIFSVLCFGCVRRNIINQLFL